MVLSDLPYNGKDDDAVARRGKSRGAMFNCCYSVCNILLLIGFLVALVVCAIFLSDDPLYEYGEHLLSLKFYRQIIYVLVILPLVLFVPLFNALSSFFGSSNGAASKWRTSIKLRTFKVAFQLLVALLILIGLVFVFPSTRWSGLASQLGMELNKHMQFRYDNEFSYHFLDTIQRQYHCCDLMWYKVNYLDKLPLSCYEPNGLYSTTYEEDCVAVLATLVSNRCILLSLALIAMLLSLAFLIGVDVIELVTHENKSNIYFFNANGRTVNQFPDGKQPPIVGIDADDIEHDSHGDQQHVEYRRSPQTAPMKAPIVLHPTTANKIPMTLAKQPRPILKDYSDDRQVPLMHSQRRSSQSPQQHHQVARSIPIKCVYRDDEGIDEQAIDEHNSLDNIERFNSRRRQNNNNLTFNDDEVGNGFERPSSPLEAPTSDDPYNQRRDAAATSDDSPLLTRAYLYTRQDSPTQFATTSMTTETIEERRQTSYRQQLPARAAAASTSAGNAQSQQQTNIKKTISFQDIDDTEDDESPFSSADSTGRRRHQQQQQQPSTSAQFGSRDSRSTSTPLGHPHF